MAVSGVKLAEDTKIACEEIKKTKSTQTFAICEVSKDEKTISLVPLDSEVTQSKTPLQTVLPYLKDDIFLYVVLKVNFKEGDKAANPKMVVILWVGQSCKVKQRMLGSSSLQAFKKDYGSFTFVECIDASRGEVKPAVCEKLSAVGSQTVYLEYKKFQRGGKGFEEADEE